MQHDLIRKVCNFRDHALTGTPILMRSRAKSTMPALTRHSDDHFLLPGYGRKADAACPHTFPAASSYPGAAPKTLARETMPTGRSNHSTWVWMSFRQGPWSTVAVRRQRSQIRIELWICK